MTNDSNPKNSARRIAWETRILRVACCAVPLAGIAMGYAVVAGLAVYSEKAAIVVAALGLAAWLIYKRVRNKPAPSCDLDCGCRPENYPISHMTVDTDAFIH